MTVALLSQIRLHDSHLCRVSLRGVGGEMALAVLAYNFKRVTNILGIPALLARLAA